MGDIINILDTLSADKKDMGLHESDFIQSVLKAVLRALRSMSLLTYVKDQPISIL